MKQTQSFSRKGINYDVGTFTRGKESSSRDTFNPSVVKREREIIKNDLHCNAIRISGQDVSRLRVAAELAIEQGLEVMFSPALVNATERETLLYFAECTKAAEGLRKKSPNIIFVAGCELTFLHRYAVGAETIVPSTG
ncbi:hypothetical protein [Bacillus sp. 165]|uniref:hypothetical protein n=1 Tax=Bacillus sp. 165 TaxID=1529117 RepID=UPI001ADCA5A5|nr:hypothetical protein [Bacillus sp. 165]MBO9128163.1 hypothetical protein [Bacillus sp. 165]